jgi:hypothetical protein
MTQEKEKSQKAEEKPKSPLEIATEIYRDNPIEPEALFTFWNEFLKTALERAGLESPEVPRETKRTLLDKSVLEEFRQNNDFPVYNPGITYMELAKAFPGMGGYGAMNAETSQGWFLVEAQTSAPHVGKRGFREKTQELITAGVKAKGMTIDNYVWASQANKLLTGEYFDEGETLSRLFGSATDKLIPAANFLPDGRFTISWQRRGTNFRSPRVGFRTQKPL